jgi:hypothetical protein
VLVRSVKWNLIAMYLAVSDMEGADGQDLYVIPSLHTVLSSLSLATVEIYC